MDSKQKVLLFNFIQIYPFGHQNGTFNSFKVTKVTSHTFIFLRNQVGYVNNIGGVSKNPILGIS